MDCKTLERLERILHYQFNDTTLLSEALTHASAADHRLKSNERLEFLGDVVLGLVICQALFEQFPEYLEGDLTKIKSRLVSRKTCAKIAKNIKLTEVMKVGSGLEKSNAINGSLAAGIFEAIIAAIYLDGGLVSARDFILRVFGPLIHEADADYHQDNYKSLLQQYAQQQMGQQVSYELLDEKGPDHNKCFETGVVIAGRKFEGAWGTNKKEAQQNAALNALIELGVIESHEQASKH